MGLYNMPAEMIVEIASKCSNGIDIYNLMHTNERFFQIIYNDLYQIIKQLIKNNNYNNNWPITWLYNWFYYNATVNDKKHNFLKFKGCLHVIKTETEETVKQNLYQLYKVGKDNISVFYYFDLRYRFNVNHHCAFHMIKDLDAVKIKKMMSLMLKGLPINDAHNAVEICETEEEFDKIFTLIGRGISSSAAVQIINYDYNDEEIEKIIQMTNRNLDNGDKLSYDVAVEADTLSDEHIESMFELINQGVEQDVARTSAHQPPEIKRILVYMVQHGISSSSAEIMIEDEDCEHGINYIIELIDNGINTYDELGLIIGNTEDSNEIEMILNLLKQNKDVKGFIQRINHDYEKFKLFISLIKNNSSFDDACNISLHCNN